MNLALTPTHLTISLEWYEQLWAFTLTQQFVIPLTHIIRATTEEPQSNWAEIRAPGTFLPGVIKAGTYYTRQGKDFWYVNDDKNYLTLELRNESYNRIILTLPESAFWAERIHSSKAV
ncbi:MAG: hypothetical protein KME16_10590 [Scytolyngbya sp. HA4215-MV1]|jgi:hypothetical protein|nr:hypothetical protein [Scytolyngbya sp. HA4215-MV1]